MLVELGLPVRGKPGLKPFSSLEQYWKCNSHKLDLPEFKEDGHDPIPPWQPGYLSDPQLSCTQPAPGRLLLTEEGCALENSKDLVSLT